jgi:hypothetical protein
MHNNRIAANNSLEKSVSVEDDIFVITWKNSNDQIVFGVRDCAENEILFG